MSGENVVPLDPNRRTRSIVVGEGAVAALIFVGFEAMMLAGLVSVFMLTRAAAEGAWPPAGQPSFPLGETGINTAALLASGALLFRAARAWETREARTRLLLTAAITLGAFFLFFQAVVWIAPIRQGLTLTASLHGSFFCLIVGIHGAHVLGTLALLGFVWLRLKQGSLTNRAFSAVRILWYFAVGVWPVLYVCLYL